MMDKHLPVSVWPEWKIVEKIGEGSFGKVYKACRTEQGTTFYSAIKVITIPSNQGELSSVRSESPNEQSVKEYFQGLVDECIQEVSTMEYFRGNSYVVSVEDYKVVEYLDDIGISYKLYGVLCGETVKRRGCDSPRNRSLQSARVLSVPEYHTS